MNNRQDTKTENTNCLIFFQLLSVYFLFTFFHKYFAVSPLHTNHQNENFRRCQRLSGMIKYFLNKRKLVRSLKLQACRLRLGNSNSNPQLDLHWERLTVHYVQIYLRLAYCYVQR